jgi:thiol-disulfide isomerase/thioredoxin
MKKLYFVVVFIFSLSNIYSQDETISLGELVANSDRKNVSGGEKGNEGEDVVLFEDALRQNLKKHNIKSDIAYKKNDLQEGEILFDSLVAKHLVGTKFKDYELSNMKDEFNKIKLSSFGKPIFLLTYASWCIPSVGEVPALNKLAQKYAEEVQFVVLFWDKRKDVELVADKFNHNISVCYAHETYKNDAVIVSQLKHTLGFPTSYFIDQNLKVVNIKRGGAQPGKDSNNYVKAYTMNYNVFREGLGSLLIQKEISDEKLTPN